jgi:hypothetical protein
MHYFITPHPAFEGEQSKNHQSSSSKLCIADRRPRQDSKNDVCNESCCQAIHIDHWCTGKDSNLRTSLGGTDLQSVGFNHSPTCAKSLGRCGRCAPADYYLQAHGSLARPTDQRSNLSLQFRKTGKPRLAQETAKITARRKSTEWSALEKPVAPLTESAVRRKIRCVSSLANYTRDFGCRLPLR